MKPRKLLLVALLAATTMLFVQACSEAGTRSTASSSSRSDFVLESRREVDEVEVKPAMRSNHLNIKKMRLDAGQLTFRLLTPAGDVQWEETFTAPADFKKTLDLEAVPGTWRLEIEIEDATGNYNIQWDAST